MGGNKIKKIGYKILKYIIPEISILKQPFSWSLIENILTDTSLGENVRLFEPYHIQKSEIGSYTYISTNSYISRTKIGKFCSIGPNFLCGWGIHPTNGLSSSPMFYSTLKQNGVTLSNQDKIEERKQITIGNDVFIGANVTILDGVIVADGAVIGAGTVVSKNIPPYAIAVGNPVQIIKYRFNKNQIDALLSIRWWEFSDENLPEIEKMFFNIDLFIEKYLI